MKATLKQVIPETDNISSFRWQAEEKFDFRPGQWMDVRLSPELKHHFTISASPTEKWLQCTTKFRPESQYKQALWSLTTGAEAEISGPFGQFILDETDRQPRLWVAGGIGITPFRSMVKYASDGRLDLPITLVYSVKKRNEGAFIDELSGLGIENFELRIVETEIDGRLTGKKLQQLCPGWKEASWWVCGPPAMVDSIVEAGLGLGVSAEMMRTEEFTGY